MKFLFITHDLILEKWHLMPWRTLVEVVSYINRTENKAVLLSLNRDDNKLFIEQRQLTVQCINKYHKSFEHNL